MDTNAHELVAQTTDHFHHRALPASHRLPQPQRRAATSRLGRPNRAHADRRAATDTGAARTRERSILDHQPQRPGWLCTGCREHWPCPTYREHMIRDAPTAQLAIVMTSWMTEAAGELPHSAPGELWKRFVAWTRRHVA